MSDLLDLAAKCEAAEGADRTLDRAIYGAFATLTGTPPYVGHMLFGKPRSSDAPEPYFTASIDAALTLVPEGMKWGKEQGAYVPNIAVIYGPTCSFVGETDGTFALALCAAALRARASQENQP